MIRKPAPLAPLALAVTLAACGGPEPAASPPPKPTPPPVASSAPPAPVASAPAPAEPTDEDLLYLEDVLGERSLAFARSHAETSQRTLGAVPGFAALEARLASIYGAVDRIPAPHVVGDKVRNFWTDGEHPRGLWRETTLADYRAAKPKWQTILDVDALGAAEKESFVWHGSTCLQPKRTRCLVRLSRGGGDAVVVRELDVEKRAFVANGFVVPEGKTRVAWKDADTIFVGTSFGPGTLTKAGYPRLAKEWRRGTPLAEAKTVFEVAETDNAATCWRETDHGRKLDVCRRSIDFWRSETFLRKGDKLVKLDKPEDADVDTWDDELFFKLRSDWTVGGATYPKGALLAAKLDAWLAGTRDLAVVFEPTATTSLEDWTAAKSRLYLTTLSDVKNELWVLSRKPGDRGKARFSRERLAASTSSASVDLVDPDVTDDTWIWSEDFAVPSSLALFRPASRGRETVKQNPSYFDAADVEATQSFATSKDGTRIPYFEVRKKSAPRPAPTVIQAYGGFESSSTAAYQPGAGAAWIERGGTLVVANIRGGGEYGPRWHEAGMRDKKQNCFDDLAAVAEDLHRRGVATPKTLGIIGGSNGGLLTSAMLVQRPELFGAIVSMVPLTDMRRYHKLLAGASWVGEYGDPDKPEDWAFISRYSPFHHVKRGAAYPPVFFTSSTRDDRVHPAHARKMVARLEALGHQPLYYENVEGGHGGAADVKQRAHLNALVYSFFSSKLGLPPR